MKGQEETFEGYRRGRPAAGRGWLMNSGLGMLAAGLAERSDDYCATAFVYCRRAQAEVPFSTTAAVRDIGMLASELPSAQRRAGRRAGPALSEHEAVWMLLSTRLGFLGHADRCDDVHALGTLDRTCRPGRAEHWPKLLRRFHACLSPHLSQRLITLRQQRRQLVACMRLARA